MKLSKSKSSKKLNAYIHYFMEKIKTVRHASTNYVKLKKRQKKFKKKN